ncbi:MAG TPA: hypothetical protein VF138_09760 [Caulobacteraceae bacterium]
MSDVTADVGQGDVDSNLALLNYALLFFSILFAGMPGLVAVVIAYAQRDSTNAALRSHYNFQIRIFWVAVAITAVAALAALGALAVGIGQLIDFSMHSGWDAWDSISFEMNDIQVPPAMIVLLSVTAICGLAACLWLLSAPVVGFIRLVSQRGMGDRAA